MSDITEVTQLVLRERQARDRGWWDRMAETYAAYVLAKRGYPVRDDLYGDDCPAEVERLYERTWEWLA